MNEFGTPMNEAELSMQPKPGRAFIQEQLSTSGIEMSFDITGLVVGTALSIFSGSKSSSAARRQAELSNEAAQRQIGYDLERWEMDKKFTNEDI